ncbi:Serine/threonine-protein phosphatase 2A activator 2 [Dimargaris cristalligena]|nr:Serine/threonine-protein phosphatase 2A activator 2 [Dimargaris cristalligena]
MADSTSIDPGHPVPLAKAILTKGDLVEFQQSPTYSRYMGFITDLNESVRGKKLTDQCPEPQIIAKLVALLDAISKLAEETPPLQTDGRFGNPAFRTFYDKAQAQLPALVAPLVRSEAPAFDSADLQSQQQQQVSEISQYLGESFGNRERIDYGTGHEANFMAGLLGLVELDLIRPPAYPALVLRVFFRYLQLMRQLQFSYWLEPAGSHGVWGLDDYHFLPFLFGSAQLCGHKYIKPKSIHDKETVDEFAKDYMYLASIKFINEVKTASLRWHSPMLDDISGVKLWDKVNSGMVKMYKAEVLGKLPIMQHFMFGTLLSFTPTGEYDAPSGDDGGPGSQLDDTPLNVPNASPISAAPALVVPLVSYGGRPLVKGEDGHTYTIVAGKKIRLNVGGEHYHHTDNPEHNHHSEGGDSTSEDPLEHIHAKGQEHPTCCGMRIPSAIGAARQQRQTGTRIPFD